MNSFSLLPVLLSSSVGCLSNEPKMSDHRENPIVVEIDYQNENNNEIFVRVINTLGEPLKLSSPKYWVNLSVQLFQGVQQIPEIKIKPNMSKRGLMLDLLETDSIELSSIIL